MAGKAIKGFSALRYWLVKANTVDEYKTETRVNIPGAVSCTMDRQSEEWQIFADDGIYDSGVDFKGDKLEITVAELGLALEAALDGADFDEESGVYSWGTNSVAPEIALGFRALKMDKTYRCVIYFSAKVLSIKIDYQTKGQGNEPPKFVISALAMDRKCDNKVLDKFDTASLDDLAWLENPAQYPAVP